MVPYTYKGSHDTYLQYAASTPKLDPAVLVPWLAQHTKHLGLVPTLSVTEYPPYLLARLGELARSRHRGPHRLELRDGQQRRRRAELRTRQASAARRALRCGRRVRRCGDAPLGSLGARCRRCSTARRRYSPMARRSIRSITRASTSRCADRSTRSSTRGPQGTGADRAGRRLAARPAVRLALGRHDHHRRRQQHRLDEGVSRRGARGRRSRSGAIRIASRCCSSPIRSSTPRWRPRANGAGREEQAGSEKYLERELSTMSRLTGIDFSRFRSTSRCRSSPPTATNPRSPGGSARRRESWCRTLVEQGRHRLHRHARLRGAA